MNSNGNFCDLVPHASAGRDRMEEMEAKLAASCAVMERYHSLCKGVSRPDFFAEFVRHYRGGEVFVRGIRIPPDDARKMADAKALEGELLASFSRMIDHIAGSVSRKYDVDREELLGEAYRGFYRALVYYNGKTKFCTFLHVCLKRHLSRSCMEGRAIKVPREVRKATMRVVDRMRRVGASFDEAVESEGIPREKVGGVVVAMSRVCSATELDIDESEMASSEDRRVSPGVMRIVEGANLTELERAVVRGFMDAPSGTMGLSKGCEGMVNPQTGRPYSRAAMSAAWKQARRKLAVSLEEVA